MGQSRKRRSGKKLTQREPGKSFYNERLNWLCGFTRARIPRLTRPRFEELLFKALDFLYGEQVEDKKEISNVCVDTPMNRDALEGIRSLFSFWLGNILDESGLSLVNATAYASPIGQTAYKLRIKEAEVELLPERRAHPYTIMKLGSLGTDRYEPLDAGIEPDQKYLERYFLDNPGVEDTNYAFFSHFYDPGIETTVLLTLVPLLQKFPLEHIKPCPQCGHCFRATKKKELDLCRPCIKKRHIYKWRKENPEAYNEYMRNLRKGVKDETPNQIRDRLAREGGEHKDKE